MKTFFGVFLVIFVTFSSADRSGKIWPFKIVSFPNDPCQTTTKNGTCYTQEECESKGGSGSGSCAQGFGVCCIITIGCGTETQENCTYIEQASTNSLSPCTYRICPCSTAVCRIRYDFETFELAGPYSESATATNDGSANGDSIGDCVTDTFSIASPGTTGTPVICGFNTGQHMIVDAGTGCQTANFNIGQGQATMREWKIKVTQFDCGLEEISGPPGCLQYHSADTGVIENFNFPSGNSVPASTTHLSNQNYEICFRRNNNKCAICYWPSLTNTQTSFGLSGASADAANGNNVIDTMINQLCTGDYVVIPHAVTTSAAALTGNAHDSHRICGRIFCSQDNCAATGTVCTGATPFRFGFVTNGGESTTGGQNTNTNELDQLPGGIIGFKLNYMQVDCS